MTDAEKIKWQDHAACLNAADPEIFFPPRGGSSREAKMFCHGNTNPALGPTLLPCPVRAACLRYSAANREQFGVWGGETAKKRRGIAEELGVERRPALRRAS
jgi:WhiB family redox-sensing transcriptional regulator